ncbi:AAA family ATPase [Novosphingobium sp. FGD1]|uniref:AAA family ATPase n=2 Tax=Novosphingobium silvae TaxID=2692619 RepID=A0A7X4KA96_9SPHN|nr:AAA family ATPase [Novosphingobium silvae]
MEKAKALAKAIAPSGGTMSVISIGNPKGGAGKTTLALVLADQLSENGVNVAVIDADPNAIIAKWAAKRTDAGNDLPYTVVPRPTESEMIQTIERLANEHDIVLIDLEGAASRMISRALARSHLVLVPFNQSPVDAELAATAVALIHEEGEALGRRIPFRLVRSRDSAAIATKTSKRIAMAIDEAGLPTLPVGLVERAAYRDIYEFGALLSELDDKNTSGLLKAQENAQQLAEAVISAVKEEYAQ